MKEIKVGEYVRTKYGEIGIVTKTYPKLMWRKKINPSLLEFNIIKNHSFNIIELIEEGDYVNGKYVSEIKQYESGKSIIALIGIIDEEDIKSIVTKEQFQNIEYRLEE